MSAPAARQTGAQAKSVVIPPDDMRLRRDGVPSDRSSRDARQDQQEYWIDRRKLTHHAVFALWSRMPQFSARVVATRPQALLLAAFGIAFFGAVCLWPRIAAHVLVACMSAGFLISMTFRIVLAWIGRSHNRPVAGITAGDGMPLYTLIVPLYREAEMLPQLARALSEIDYPRDCLDIKLVVEEDDAPTMAAAKAAVGSLPAELVVVPKSQPRTKPKACNYALPLARGEYVVVYDAEDRPEPDQLRKAVGRFRQTRNAACLQARLSIDNDGNSWLARMFALDYDLWFRMLLPGLSRLGAPMPLGGTSNHFRTSILRAAGAWDPFNVTEDADLGIRLARLGYRVAMLDSATFEEAPARFDPWLRQRTRWIKGYMQTLLVHTRRPPQLVRDLGWHGVATILFFLGGAVWSVFINPVLWIIFIASLIGAQAHAHAQVMESLARISGIGLLLCNAVLAILSRTATRKVMASAPYAVGYVIYWILVSLAAYRALWQLVFHPFRWEKTPHETISSG